MLTLRSFSSTKTHQEFSRRLLNTTTSIISEGIYARSITINITKNITWIEAEWCLVTAFSRYLDLRELSVIDRDLSIGTCIIWSSSFDFFSGHILRLSCSFLMLLSSSSCSLDNWSLLLNDMFPPSSFSSALHFVMSAICF